MYKLKLYLFKLHLLINKITNRTCWILDIALYGTAINYHNWLTVERIDNVLRLVNQDIRNHADIKTKEEILDDKLINDLVKIRIDLIIKKRRYKKW